MRIWTVAPAAYQKGPATPYVYATVDDWSKVAAQVQAETMPEAMSPGLTEREAVLNSSDWWVEYCVYRFWRYDMNIIKNAKKKPMPMTTPALCE
jgi:hypothetical protein